MRFLLSFSSLLFVASPVLAEITAEDVWSNLQAPITAMGGQMSAATTRQNNQLEVGEISIAFELPMEAGQVSMIGSGFTLAENGDGTVEILYPAQVTMSLAGESAEGSFGPITMVMDTDAYTSQASGSPGDIAYTYNLDGAQFAVEGLALLDGPASQMSLQGMMTGMDGTYRITEGDLLTMTTSGGMGEMTYDMAMTDESGIESLSSQTSSGGQTDMTLVIPNGTASLMNLSQALRDGMRLDLALVDNRVEMRSEARVNDEIVMVQHYGYLAEEINYQMDASGLRGDGINSDAWFEISFGALMPAPIKGQMDRVTGALDMPLNRTDGATPARMAMSLESLVLEEAVWVLFDPTAQLPRTPVALDLALSSSVEALIDLLDINTLIALIDAGDTPLLFRDVTLERLMLRAAGAQVDASGETTLDYADRDTYGGMPALDGTLDLRIDGANALIDRLIAIGLLPEEQALGARMMMGMFTVPGDGDDVLVSTIEARPDGQVIANGQRLR